MNDSNVAERLKTFIESKGLTYSQFADMCGIPRPSLSQLLTGRNKKISDILVGQIHNMFPELSIVWLLFGEGLMEVKNNNVDPQEESPKHNYFADSLFSLDDNEDSESKKIIFSSNGKDNLEISQGNGVKKKPETSQNIDLLIQNLQNKIKDLQSQIEILKKNPRKVAHITIYYDDSTFETFFPG